MRIAPRTVVAIVTAVLAAGASAALAQVGTAFTYQGRLTDGGTPASGLYDLELRLWTAASGGSQVGSTLTLTNVTVSSGLFTVAPDFGAGTFPGQRRWLAIGVRPGGSGGPFTTLAPRQELTPVANAVFASNAATVNGLSCSSGAVAKWNGSGWACGTDVDTNSGGTVTSVATGAGLTGGPITSNGTLGIATGGVTSAMIANGAVGSAQINTAQVQTRLASICPGGQFLRGVNADGSLICESFDLPPTVTVVDDPPAASVGGFLSMAIGTDGFPVISYRDYTAQALKVAKCVNAACTGASTITTVDDPADDVGGSSTSLAIGTDGFPVISYYDFTAGTLKVAKCVNAACTGASTITVVDDPANSVGRFTSIAIGTDGLPVISYQDETAGTLKVAKCVNTACTGTSTITTVDDPADTVGQFTSIAIGTDGLPVISYYDTTAGTLRVAKCANASCTGVATVTTVDDPGDLVGQHTAITIGADGFPIISYLDVTAFALKVAKCVNAACTGTSTITFVDNPFDSVGLYTSIAIGADGLPVISYYDWTAGDLRVAKCVNAACTGSSAITTVDRANNVGQYSSIKIGTDGLPVIAYFDNNTNSLKVAKCHKASCAP